MTTTPLSVLLKKWRTRYGLSQASAALCVGVSERTWRRWECEDVILTGFRRQSLEEMLLKRSRLLVVVTPIHVPGYAKPVEVAR